MLEEEEMGGEACTVGEVEMEEDYEMMNDARINGELYMESVGFLKEIQN